MNAQDRLKENRRDYWSKFFLGFLGGSGLLSIIVLAIYNFFSGDRNRMNSSTNDKNARSPEQFETIYRSSDRK